MYGHWYIVASQQTARIYTETTDHTKLRVLKEFDNPLLRVSKDRLVRHDDVGHQIRGTGSLGSVRYGGERVDPHDEAATDFAKEISQYLLKELDKKNFVSLTVVAESGFLGKLRAAMKPRVDGHVIEWMRKDLVKVPDILLPEFLLQHTKRERADESGEAVSFRTTSA